MGDVYLLKTPYGRLQFWTCSNGKDLSKRGALSQRGVSKHGASMEEANGEWGRLETKWSFLFRLRLALAAARGLVG